MVVSIKEAGAVRIRARDIYCQTRNITKYFLSLSISKWQSSESCRCRGLQEMVVLPLQAGLNLEPRAQPNLTGGITYYVNGLKCITITNIHTYTYMTMTVHQCPSARRQDRFCTTYTHTTAEMSPCATAYGLPPLGVTC